MPTRKAGARGHVFGGLRSSIRSGGSEPYRAGSYRLTRQSPGLSGCARHTLEPAARGLRRPQIRLSKGGLGSAQLRAETLAPRRDREAKPCCCASSPARRRRTRRGLDHSARAQPVPLAWLFASAGVPSCRRTASDNRESQTPPCGISGCRRIGHQDRDQQLIVGTGNIIRPRPVQETSPTSGNLPGFDSPMPVRRGSRRSLARRVRCPAPTCSDVPRSP